MMPPAILLGAVLLGLLLAGLLIGLGLGMLAGRAAGLQGAPRVLTTLGFAGLSLLLGAFIGIVHYSALRKRERDARDGWNLVPVVVAAVDIPAGTTLTFDMISQRSVPEQFVTADIVKPDSASYIVNERIAVGLMQGDLFTWPAVCAVTPAPAQTP